MEEIGQRLIGHYVPFTNIPLPLGGVNVITVYNTVMTVLLLWCLLWLAVRRANRVPTRGQLVFEIIVGAFDGLVTSLLEFPKKEQNRHFLPLIMGLFLFILVSNSIVMIPYPHAEEPTSDINCTLALGLMVVIYSIYCSIHYHGIKHFFIEMCGPMFHEGTLGKLSALGFFPLHIVETLSRVVSISCRLFGNITGAAIITIVVSTLTFYVFTPFPMYAFFLFFEAGIQAFVFSMLALIYITVAIR